MEFFHKPTSFPFMSTRKVWYGLSILLMLISIGSFFGRGLNLAIDFTGGVRIEAAFPQAANIDAVRSALQAAGFPEAPVENFGSSREISIRLPPQPGQDSAAIRARSRKNRGEVGTKR